jgi:hypothetical protein
LPDDAAPHALREILALHLPHHPPQLGLTGLDGFVVEVRLLHERHAEGEGEQRRNLADVIRCKRNAIDARQIEGEVNLQRGRVDHLRTDREQPERDRAEREHPLTGDGQHLGRASSGRRRDARDRRAGQHAPDARLSALGRRAIRKLLVPIRGPTRTRALLDLPVDEALHPAARLILLLLDLAVGRVDLHASLPQRDTEVRERVRSLSQDDLLALS